MLSPNRIVETDGLGADLMGVVCAWCKKDMGTKVCVPEMAGKVSHGICPECTKKTLGALAISPGPQDGVASQPAPLAGVNGTAGRNAAVEHAGASPATSTFTAPLFWTVMGTDFGRSIAWAKKQPNEMTRQIRAGIARRAS